MIRKFRAGLALQPVRNFSPFYSCSKFSNIWNITDWHMKQIATALFANSPFTEGKTNGFLSMRRFIIFLVFHFSCILSNLFFPWYPHLSFYSCYSHIWTDTDRNRTGMLPFVFDDSFGYICLFVILLDGKLLIKFWSLIYLLAVHSVRYLWFFLLVFLCRFEQYVDYALDVPMYFVYREKKYIDCTGMTFRVFIYP